MCFGECFGKYKVQCTVTGLASLIVHVLLSCLSVTALAVDLRKGPPDLIKHYLIVNANYVHFGNLNRGTFLGLSGVGLALGVLGFLASVILIIGARYNKPGCVVVYICYGVQSSIVLLIGTILFSIKMCWAFAIFTLCLSALTLGFTISVNKCYNTMVQDELIKSQNNNSDLTLLIDDDSIDDLIISTS